MNKNYFFVLAVAFIISLFLYTTSCIIEQLHINQVFNLNHDYSLIEDNLNNSLSTPIGTLEPSDPPTPSIEPTPKKPVKNTKYNQLVGDIKKYLSNQQGTYGIYFLNLDDGLRFGINENKYFTAASTVKIPVSLYLYYSAATNKIDLDSMVEYIETDYEEGTGDIQYESYGTAYSLRELSQKSIEISDNVAVNMLIRYLDFEDIHQYMDKLVKHTVPRDVNEATPRDMAIYLKTLLDLTHKNKIYNELLNYLTNTAFNDRLPLYLPPDVKVAHKIGTQVQAFHDVGIIFADVPYILCVMSEEVDEEAASEVIATISKMVYEYTQN